eukprot:3546469-Amphidinium_carterae.2
MLYVSSGNKLAHLLEARSVLSARVHALGPIFCVTKTCFAVNTRVYNLLDSIGPYLKRPQVTMSQDSNGNKQAPWLEASSALAARVHVQGPVLCLCVSKTFFRVIMLRILPSSAAALARRPLLLQSLLSPVA